MVVKSSFPLPTYMEGYFSKGGLITLTEIILHCQTKYLMKDLHRIPLAEKHCHHLRKKVTLKFLNDTVIMCSKVISIRSTEF